MIGTRMLHFTMLAGMTLFCVAGLVRAQPSETATLLAANAAFETAISQRDINAMAALWSQDEKVVALHPRAKQLDIGWEAVRKSWETVFERFSELKVHMQQPIVRVNAATGWVTGVEVVEGRRKSGDAVSYTAFTSNAFEKKEGRWVMTLHYVSIVPKE